MGSWNLSLRRSWASGVHSNRSRGEGVDVSGLGGGWGFVLWRLSSVRRMKWSDRMGLCEPIWKLRTSGVRVGDVAT